MNKKLLSLFALITLTVGIAIAVNDVPDNGLKFAGNRQEAELQYFDLAKWPKLI